MGVWPWSAGIGGDLITPVIEGLKVDNLARQDIVQAGISWLIRTIADG